MTTEELVAGLQVYHGKSVSGYSFIVTPESLTKAAEKCGVDAVQRFFSDGVNAVVDGKTVSDWLGADVVQSDVVQPEKRRWNKPPEFPDKP